MSKSQVRQDNELVRTPLSSRISAPFKSGPVRAWIDNLSRRFTFLNSIWLRVRWTKAKLLTWYSDFEHAQRSFASRGEVWDSDSPSTFNEKLWYLKLSNRDPLLVECSDKHDVRAYVERCGLGHILKREYASVSSVEELDLSTLPSPTYIKCSHGSGLNWVYRADNSQEEIRKNLRTLSYQLRQNPYLFSREWNYKSITPTLVCEQVLEMPNGEQVPELQFFCFHGEVKFIMYNVGLADETGAHQTATRWVFSPDYEHIDIKTSMPTSALVPPKPTGFEAMLEYAETLAAPFPHVRVDLFNVDGTIYFNEMTFYSGGGFVTLEPAEWQKTVGAWLNIDEYSIAPDALEGGFKKMISSFAERKPA